MIPYLPHILRRVFIMDEDWLNFWETGSVNDYLNYKKNEKAYQNDDYDQRLSNQRTDNWGE